jgi:hypothetical protein
MTSFWDDTPTSEDAPANFRDDTANFRDDAANNGDDAANNGDDARFPKPKSPNRQQLLEL